MKISRRDFLRMAAYSAAAVGATQFDMFKLNQALAGAGNPPVIWFEGLGDSGCVVSLANYFDGANAGIDSVLLNKIDLQFESVLMGASGDMAITAAKNVYNNYLAKPYILVLSGALSELNGYAIVGEDTSIGGLGVMNVIDAFNLWQSRARATLFVGACACYGGVNMIGGNQLHNVPEASPPTHNGPPSYPTTRNTTFNNNRSLFIPGCPAHPDWIVLSMVHIIQRLAYPVLTSMPSRDSYRRPNYLQLSATSGEIGYPNSGPKTYLFQNKTDPSILADPAALGTVHEQCSRRAQHDLGNFAAYVGDVNVATTILGGDPELKCMRKVGCRGIETYADCPTRGWNSTGTARNGKWCTAKGINHICIGCSQPMFPAVPFNREIILP
jgi:hydrogenase small subunit